MKIHKLLIKRKENEFSRRLGISGKRPIRKFSSAFSNVTYDPNNDYYKVLNISDKSDLKEIKKSFYKLSLESHPDKGGNEENFKKINSAYETLKDEQQKKQYDLIRKEYLAAFDIKFNSNNAKNDYASANKNNDRYKNSNYNSSKESNRNQYYQNKQSNFYDNFYKENNYDNKSNRSERHTSSNYNSNNNYNNKNYYYSSGNSYDKNKYQSYNFYDFEKEYKRDNEDFRNFFYEYYEDLLKKANFNFRNQYRKYHENKSDSANKQKSEQVKADEKAKVMKDSVNDFNYINDNLINSRYDNRTNSYFESFKINRLQKPQKEFKFENFEFKENNIHNSERRIQALNEELKEFEKNNFLKRKFILKEKPKFNNNPFGFDSIKYNEKSNYNIEDAMNSNEERDSESIDNRIKLRHYFELMDKKIFFFYLTAVLTINYFLFRKNIKFSIRI